MTDHDHSIHHIRITVLFPCQPNPQTHCPATTNYTPRPPGPPIQVGDQLVLVVAHSGAEVGNAHVRLLGPAEVGLGDEHVPHGEHAQAAQLLGSVEHHGREAAGHLGVQADLDTGLDLRKREGRSDMSSSILISLIIYLFFYLSPTSNLPHVDLLLLVPNLVVLQCG